MKSVNRKGLGAVGRQVDDDKRYGYASREILRANDVSVREGAKQQVKERERGRRARVMRNENRA